MIIKVCALDAANHCLGLKYKYDEQLYGSFFSKSENHAVKSSERAFSARWQTIQPRQYMHKLQFCCILLRSMVYHRGQREPETQLKVLIKTGQKSGTKHMEYEKCLYEF